ncbi:MAG: FtsX-like permease family protein [Planctomycetes bacterium]|nr:FtsX-like permease family protein [Planctomycetota bacterium]
MRDTTHTSSRRGLIETDSATIGRQIQLPLSKAVEISYKSVKIRLWRSLITASGIVLAITFLMATLTSSTTTAAMKAGIPVRLAAVKKKQGELKLAAREKAPTVSKDAPTLKRFLDNLQSDEIKLAANVLEGEMKDHPERSGDVADLKSVMDQLLVTSAELEKLNKMRLEMIKRGESVPVVDESGGKESAAVAANVADKDQEDAKSRENWLIFLALGVAFVGIMNSMLMSVTERFREIGTMKCLGALDMFILKLFLIESSMMGLIGTSCGVLLGLVMSLGKFCWDFDSSVLSFVPGGDLGSRVLFALFVGTALALSGAVLPAIIAARMEPVAAMRVDQ